MDLHWITLEKSLDLVELINLRVFIIGFGRVGFWKERPACQSTALVFYGRDPLESLDQVAIKSGRSDGSDWLDGRVYWAALHNR